MKNLLCAGAVVFALVPPRTSAQSTEAARYVNPQGIEVIQARQPPASLDQQGADKPALVSKPAAGAAKNSAVRDTTPSSSKLPATAQGQRVRDDDRLGILRLELANEGNALENKLRILATPAMQSKLAPDELKRLQETVVDHEKNIRSLNAEIERVRHSR